MSVQVFVLNKFSEVELLGWRVHAFVTFIDGGEMARHEGGSSFSESLLRLKEAEDVGYVLYWTVV